MPTHSCMLGSFVGANTTLNTTCGTLPEYSTALLILFEISGIEDSALLSKRPFTSLAN